MRSSSPLLGLAGLLLASTATAQCYDPNLGTLVGTGDDVLFGAQAVGFAFPLGGTAYTDCHISTNGWVAFSNAGVPAAPTSSYWNFGPTNLLASNPVIAPLGHDLVATTSGVFINLLGTHTTITWDQVYEYSSTIEFTVQLALYPNGDYSLTYSPEANQIYTTNACTVGIADGSTPADPGVTDISATTSFPTIFYELYDNAALPFDLGNTTQYFIADPTGYTRVVLCEGAYNGAYGAGCTQVPVAFYEHFPTGTGDLDGTTLVLTQNASGGYDSTPVPLTTFNAPTSTHLGFADNTLAVLTLPFTFDYPGGSTNTITITDNGRCFLNGNGIYDYVSSAAKIVTATDPILIPLWFDGDPDPLSPNNAYFDVVSPTEVNITFLDYPRYPAAYGDTEKFQIALIDNGTNDHVEFRIDHMMNDGFRGIYSGWTPGTGTVDFGSYDLSAGTVSSGATEVFPLSLSADVNPVFGTTVTYTVDNIRELAPGLGTAIVYASFQQIVPMPLSALGVSAPGCDLNIGLAMQPFSALLINAPTDTVTFAVPNVPNWAGLTLNFQAACLAPGENGTGIAVSNGLTSVLQAQ